jgi:hypothetical protein
MLHGNGPEYAALSGASDEPEAQVLPGLRLLRAKLRPSITNIDRYPPVRRPIRTAPSRYR